ncbi:hypothetical protein MBLNU230_g6283t1 [Neophaeotheca triangularis]
MSAPKRKRSPSPEPQKDTNIYRSTALDDRDSTFRAYFSPGLPGKELQKLPEIASANHRILGSRRESNQQSLSNRKQYITDSDDDGEKWAGRRVEGALKALNVEGSVVVARWFGGTMLGPVRFEHIENVVREVVGVWREATEGEERRRKKAKEEAEERERLVEALGERDQSVRVLRELAKEKEEAVRKALAELAGGEEALGELAEAKPDQEVGKGMESSRAAIVAPPTPDYGSMPLAKLRALEKARDATLAFLLKRIDKAESQLQDDSKGGRQEEGETGGAADEKPP